MKTQMIKMIVFDMAGTTVRDNNEVENCFVEAARASDLKFNVDEIISMMGWSKRQVFETLWKKNLHNEQNTIIKRKTDNSYRIFKEILEDHYTVNPVLPAEGAIELFDFLKKNKIKIALTTGFYRKVTDIILSRLGWDNGLDINYLGNNNSIIDISISSDQVNQGRPAPDMIFRAMKMLNVSQAKGVIKIGDTPSDIQAGKNADCLLSFGVTNGTHTRGQLEKIPNDGLFKNLFEFMKYLDKTHVSPAKL